MTAARADFIPDFPARRPSAAEREHHSDNDSASVTDMTELIAARQIFQEANQLMAARQVIEEAKGLLMSTARLTEPEAHRWIQKTAMDRRTGMATIALGIIEALSDKT
jgi:AmiR/NasT family two-component response regulator